ncbi:hypothetical protein NL676_031831 [Syzygium grande]|nr:hypothetical protein NL676_031831 [Syzygium grande]
MPYLQSRPLGKRLFAMRGPGAHPPALASLKLGTVRNQNQSLTGEIRAPEEPFEVRPFDWVGEASFGGPFVRGVRIRFEQTAMDYELSDSSGTDDDLPPTHNRFQRGPRTAGNPRSNFVGPPLLPSVHGDMETQIHNIEQEAYCSVLRAFKAQSDAITWEKESLITELRKELRVSDEEHRELLSRVNADDMIRRIREWRKARGLQPGMLSTSQPVHDVLPSPTVSASRKKQKTSQSVASLSMGAPSPALHPSMQQPSGSIKRGPPPGPRSKKQKSSMQYPSAGKRVWTRWPDDNNFYEAVITDYNAAEGRHALVYDINTADETWEWVNLKEISPEDIRWEGEDPGVSRRGGRPGPGRGTKKTHDPGTTKAQTKKDVPLSQNGVGKKALGDIELLHTDTLIKEVEKVFGASHPDPTEIEKAKKVLKEHEQALVDAISRLEDASDGESDGGEHHKQGQTGTRVEDETL